MPATKATVKQSDLARMFKAWKAAWETPPTAHIRPDGSVVLSPSEASEAPEEEEALTELQKWQARNAERQ